MKFRYDINGLRAIAVIAVVLYHFNPVWLPGGFAGVDVFFVISGFLMTGIIFRGFEGNSFNLLKFYTARAKRIIPALTVICLSLLLFGWFFLSPIEYKELSKHAGSSLIFLSNFIYWKESGYFDVASHEKWLLHTWSLSAEWQFYIIYPIVLMILKQCLPLEKLKRLIVICTFLGFVCGVALSMKWPTSSYYLLPARAWEMMVGGIAYLYPWSVSEAKKKRLEIVGMMLILTSYIFFSSDNLWPGYLALFPVLGTYLVIITNRQESNYTNNRVFNFLGKCSYSIYLVHWPIIVAINKFGLHKELSTWLLAFLYFLSVATLGGLITRYVESSTGIISNASINLLAKKVIFLSALFFSILTYNTNGAEKRHNDNYSLSEEQSRLRANYGLSKRCDGKFTLSESCRTHENVNMVVWGDSFAMHIVPAILSSNPNVKLIQMTKSTCGPLLNISKPRKSRHNWWKGCIKFNDDVKKWLINNRENVDYVVLSAQFKSYISEVVNSSGEYKKLDLQGLKKELYNTITFINGLDMKAIIVSPPPTTGQNFGSCLSSNHFLANDLSTCDFNPVDSNNMNVIDSLSEIEGNYKYIRLDDYLCDTERCNASFNGKYVYRDTGHLSYEGAEELGRLSNLFGLITN